MDTDKKESSELASLMLIKDFFKKIIDRMDVPHIFYCSRSNRTTKRGSPYLRKTLFNIMTVHLQRAPADEPVFQFLDKKRAEESHTMCT